MSMAKKPPTVYEPGELDRLRKKLGDLDPHEAKKLAEKLGGEVGIERATPEPPKRQHRQPHQETVDVTVGGRPGGFHPPKHRIEILPEAQNEPPPKQKKRTSSLDPADDPSVPVRTSYRERVRMDRYAAQVEFEIKNPTQIFYSLLSLFGEPPDLINPDFVTKRMNEYYNRIEVLVTSTRSLLPRNQPARNERFKKVAAFAYSIIDTIRYWNIEKINSDLSRLQARPRTVKLQDFGEILKNIYRPLFLLELLDPEKEIRDAYKTLYKLLFEENPQEAREKHQALIRASLGSYAVIRRNIRFLLYPLLLKTLSDQWFSYEEFFTARPRRLMDFLKVSETDRIKPLPPEVAEEPGTPTPQVATPAQTEPVPADEPEKTEPEKEAAEAGTTEPMNRALQRGLDTLELLFPEAGWNRLPSFPDLYPYFSDIFDLKKGYELIAPNDPLQQVVVLMHILEELFYALRYVTFGSITAPDGSVERVDEGMTRIISGWHGYIEETLDKEYLPRLSEYCRMLDGAAEARTSNYAKRTQMELYWLRRLYFLPYFRFESVAPPPFRRQEIIPLYGEVRQLRRLLSAVALGMEKGAKEGGMTPRGPCDGIDNPWDLYIFQVPNPLSIRLDALLGNRNPRRKTNATLIFHTLAVVVVLDQLINNENSWAYGQNVGPIFRSVDGGGIKPQFGVDEKVDTEQLFKEALKQKTE